MKVTKINNTYQKPIVKKSCMQKVRHFFTRNPKGIKIKVLLEDVFDSTLNRRGWFNYLGPSRDLPNCVSGPDEDYDYVYSGRFEFYPEDVEKMRTMTREEKREFRRQLLLQNRYINISNEDTKNQ